MSDFEEVETFNPFETGDPDLDILNRVFKDTSFHKSLIEWVDKNPTLTEYDIKYLVSAFLFAYSNQEIVDDFYKTTSYFETDKEVVEFVLSINKQIGNRLYRKLEPYAYERNEDKYELKIKLVGIEFLFTFSDFSICALNKKYHVDYFPKFKGVQHMFGKDTRVSFEKLTPEAIRLNIYYGESSEIYTLEYNEFDDTPTEIIPLSCDTKTFTVGETHLCNSKGCKSFTKYTFCKDCNDKRILRVQNFARDVLQGIKTPPIADRIQALDSFNYKRSGELEYTSCLEKLKLYSIQKKLLYEKVINWNLLFEETNQTITKYLTEVSKLHEVNYFTESDLSECLPSEAYSQLLFEIIYLWYPFYDDLERSVQQEIEDDIGRIF